MSQVRATHWDRAYTEADAHSWDQRVPDRSLALLTADGPPASVIDVGGGASRLVDGLLARGVDDVTVLDVSQVALDEAATRLGERATAVGWIATDVLTWTPPRRYAAWHDRAVFHFLTDPADRAAYRQRLHDAVAPGGLVVVATFAPDGPDACSGLPVARYAPDELATELDLPLDGLVTDREVHTTPWGSAQAFTWIAARLPA